MIDLHSMLVGAGAAISGFLLMLAGRKTATSSRGIPQTPIGAPGVSPPAPTPPVVKDGLTARAAGELISHEAIVQESYRDSENIWTWGIGVTDASGHKIGRYIDHPQPVQFCLLIFVWLLRTRYLPPVLQAFAGHQLTEAQLAAALSFHYNTGAILHASWVGLWKHGEIEAAKHSIMGWDHPPSITSRRQKECNLFFDGVWSSDGTANVLPVLKPSYQPDFHHPTRVDVATPLRQILGG